MIIGILLLSLGFIGIFAVTIVSILVSNGQLGENKRLSPTNAKLQLFLPSIVGSVCFALGIALMMSQGRNEVNLGILADVMAIIAISWSIFVFMVIQYRKRFVAD